MRIQFAAATAIAALTLATSLTPLEAKVPARPKPSAARTMQAQPETPPIGYCMKCLPPPYQWPRGGPG